MSFVAGRRCPPTTRGGWRASPAPERRRWCAEVTPELLDAYVGPPAWTPASAAAIRRRAPRSIIVAPLPARGRTLGALLLVTYGDPPAGRRAARARGGGGQPGRPALDNARLLRREPETAERLRLLQEATAALSSAPAPTSVAEAAVEQARALLGATSATIFRDRRVGPGGARARRAHRPRASGAGSASRSRPPRRVTDAARERRPVWIESRPAGGSATPSSPPEAERRGSAPASRCRSWPGDDVVGAVALAFDEDRRFGAADRDTAAGCSPRPAARR